jgi:hydrogenase maturation protease
VEVASRLSSQTLPPGVRVADFGIRGVHLAYELLDGYDCLILVDAVPMGEPAGTVALIEPEQAAPAGPAHADGPAGADTPDDPHHPDHPDHPSVQVGPPDRVNQGAHDDHALLLDAHSMNPDVVLATLAWLGGSLQRCYVVACQPASLEEGIGLTPPVAAAVDGAVQLCQQLLAELSQPAGTGISP